MSVYTQQDRRLLLATPLGADALLLSKFEGTEELSRPFSFRLGLLSERPRIAPKSLVGKSVTFGVRRADGEVRHFNGIVRSFSYHGTDDRLSLYSAEVVPWFWLLTRTTDCRIFQNKTVLEIVEQIFKELGFTDYEKSDVRGHHPRWEYRVQYMESDFAFVSRLLEQEGIFYYFRHENGRHVMVLADGRHAYRDAAERRVLFAPNNLSEVDATDLVTSWEHRYEFRSGRVSHADYNFKTPAAKLAAGTRSLQPFDGAERLELFEYPGLYQDRHEAEAYAKLRIEEEEADQETVHASSRCRTFGPGLKFRLASHHNPDEEGLTYVVTSIRHRAAQPGSYVSGGELPPEEYTNDFTCVPDSVTFRPPRTTPKPSVRGCQTAVVVGPAGQEIYTDKFGRIKAHFHWDRHGKRDEHSSCWIRVAHLAAGPGYGLVTIPRVGHEVVISFVDGDPDRPLVTGCVYNASNMPPVSNAGRKPTDGPKPADATEAAHHLSLRSNSLGGSGGHNEITMTDAGGKEVLYLKAQKDENHEVGNNRNDKVGNDETTEVGNNRTDTVGNDETRSVANNRTRTVGVDETITIGSNQTVSVGANETVTVGANRSVTVAANETHSVAVSRALTVGVAHNDMTGAVRTVETGVARIDAVGLMNAIAVGMLRFTVVGMNDILVTGMGKTEKIGTDYIVEASGNAGIKAGGMLVLECPDITLKAPGGFVRIDAGGVTISGKKVKVNSGGSAGSLPGSAGAAAAGGGGSGGGGAPGGGSAGSASATASAGSSATGAAGAAAEKSDFVKNLEKLGVGENTAKLLDKISNGDTPSLNDITRAAPNINELLAKVPDKYLPPEAKKVVGGAATYLDATELDPGETDAEKKAAKERADKARDSVRDGLKDAGKKEIKKELKDHGIDLDADPNKPNPGTGTDKNNGPGAPGSPNTGPSNSGGGGAGGPGSKRPGPDGNPGGNGPGPGTGRP